MVDVDDVLHCVYEVFCLFSVGVVLFAAECLEFAVGDLFAELVEYVHGVCVFLCDEVFSDEFLFDEVCEVSGCWWDLSETHERGVC